MPDEDAEGAEYDEPEINDDDGEMPWESSAREAVERALFALHLTGLTIMSCRRGAPTRQLLKKPTDPP
jgi:hypothetical protein